MTKLSRRNIVHADFIFQTSETRKVKERDDKPTGWVEARQCLRKQQVSQNGPLAKELWLSIRGMVATAAKRPQGKWHCAAEYKPG